MPKSRKRRPSQAARNSHDPRRLGSRQEQLNALMPEIALMQEADAAERRGDVLGAIETMMRRPFGPDGELFWRPERLRRLNQIAWFAPLLPDWAIGRWLLAQALQSLDSRDRSARLTALRIAIDLRGGLSGLPGVDDDDRRCKVVDHDWVYRQTYLYELGGLSRFLRGGASPEIVADAGRIGRWGSTHMGAYRLVDRRSDVVVWRDLADDAEMTVVNTGCAALVVPEECVLGRVVPTAGRPAFEAAPLRVSEACARATAVDPSSWLDALRADPPMFEGVVTTGGRTFDLLSDLPAAAWMLALDPLSDSELESGVDVEVAVEAIADAVLDRARSLVGEATSAAPDPQDIDPWAAVAAALIEPAVCEAIDGALCADDRATLTALGHRIAEPAASVCRELAMARGG